MEWDYLLVRLLQVASALDSGIKNISFSMEHIAPIFFFTLFVEVTNWAGWKSGENRPFFLYGSVQVYPDTLFVKFL